jgi:hypothetical protein
MLLGYTLSLVFMLRAWLVMMIVVISVRMVGAILIFCFRILAMAYARLLRFFPLAQPLIFRFVAAALARRFRFSAPLFTFGLGRRAGIMLVVLDKSNIRAHILGHHCRCKCDRSGHNRPKYPIFCRDPHIDYSPNMAWFPPLRDLGAAKIVPALESPATTATFRLKDLQIDM